MELLSRILRAAQVRIFWQLFLLYFGFLLAAACSALLVTAVLQFLFGRPPFQPEFLWCALGAVLLGTLFLLWRTHPDLGRTAQILDKRGQTKDRYSTGFSFGQSPERQRMEEAAFLECQRFIEKNDWRALTPIRAPRSILVAFAPLLAIGLLQWQFLLSQEPPLPDPSLRAVVNDQAKKLDQLVQQIEQARRVQQSAELEQLVKELRNTSKRITEQRPTNEEIRRAALREFSSLQAMLEEMMKAGNLETSPEELKALAEALKQMNQEEAAKKLEEGKYEEAAKKLEELMQQLQKGANPEKTRQQLADSMKEAVDRLSEDQKKQVAEQMQQLAEAAKAMQDPEIQKQLQKLQELMQQLAKSQKGKPSQQQQQGDPQQGQGQPQQMPLTAEALQQMIEALERMKQQLQEGQQPGEQDGPMISMQMPGMDGQPGMNGSMESNGPPSGNPGSELDFGTTETPFGATQAEKAKAEGPAKRITGVLGEGESLREFIGAAGDDSKAQQRYKEIYQAMAAQAQDTVTQETIPLGSRLLIRRYFENIRPKE